MKPLIVFHKTPNHDSIWNNPSNHNEKKDTDLDDKLESENFGDIWSKMQQDQQVIEIQPPTTNPSFSFSYYSKTTTGSVSNLPF